MLENPVHLDNPKDQELSNKWFSLRKSAAVEQKDKVGLLFMTKVLGLSQDIADSFVSSPWKHWEVIGHKQSAAPEGDLSQFWNSVSDLFPGLMDERELNYLINEGKTEGVLHFLFQIDEIGAERSQVLRLLADNAHSYK